MDNKKLTTDEINKFHQNFLNNITISAIDTKNFEQCKCCENWRKEKIYISLKKSKLKDFILTRIINSDINNCIYGYYLFMNAREKEEDFKSTVLDYIDNDSVIIMTYYPVSVFDGKYIKECHSIYNKNLSKEAKEIIEKYKYDKLFFEDNLELNLINCNPIVLLRKNEEDIELFYKIKKEIKEEYYLSIYLNN